MAYVSTPYVWATSIIPGTNGNAVKLDSATCAAIGTYATIGADPIGVAVDADGNVWVVSADPDNATKLNGSTGAVIGTYNVGYLSGGIAVDADGNVWVTNSNDNNITKLNGSSGVVIGTYAVGNSPGSIAIDANGSVWVTNWSSDNVTKLNGSTGAVIGAYSTGHMPIGLAVDADSNIWIANRSSSGNTVVKLSGSTGSVIGGCRVGEYPGRVAVDVDNNVWVTVQSPDSIVKLSPNGIVIGTYAIDCPIGLAADADGSILVVSLQPNTVTKVNCSTGAIIGTYSSNQGDGMGISTGFELQRFTLGYYLPVTGVTVSPGSALLAVGASRQFTAAVSRGDGTSGVTWSAPDGGSVTGGLFTPPSAAGSYRVVAASVEDATKSATATVTVTANHIIKLGDYTFPRTFYVSATPSETRVGTSEIPRRDGVAVGSPRLKERTISVKGMLRGDSPDELRSAMDSLLAAVNAGRQKFYLWDDRFIWATKTGLTTDYDEAGFGRYAFAGVDFLCDSPFWESLELSMDTWTGPESGGTHILSTLGNAYTMPVFRFTVSGTGTLSVKLSLGEEYFTLSGSVSDGDVFVVDCGAETVTLESDGSDCMGMFDSSFFRLAGGAENLLAFTKVSGDSVISQVVTTWRNRWY